MQREFQHNTPQQVRDYLREALDIVDELGPPDYLRAVCFDKAANMVAAKQIIYEPVQPHVLGLGVPRGV